MRVYRCVLLRLRVMGVSSCRRDQGEVTRRRKKKRIFFQRIFSKGRLTKSGLHIEKEPTLKDDRKG